MHQPINIRLFELALGLCLGVLFAHYHSFPKPELNNIYLGIGLIVLSSYLISFYLNPRLWWFSRLWFFIMWMGLGGVHYAKQQPKLPLTKETSKHIDTRKGVRKALLPPLGDAILRQIEEQRGHQNTTQLQPLELQYSLKAWGKTRRYLARFHNLQNNSAYPVVVITRDSILADLFSPDKTLWIFATPQVIEGPKNPGGFDLKAYYHSQGIEQLIDLDLDQVYCWSHHPLSLRAHAQKINTKLARNWRKAPISQEAKALALAIVLGQTEDLTPEIKTQFANAGALHVLALSGLHVGLVVFVLRWLFKPLKFLPFGSSIHALVLLGLLWSYATICGLSPSITRAVCMFSVWQIGQLIGRPISGSNSVLLTFIALLWWSPYWLFSVGFQLSFTAVMALTYFPSRIQKLWRPKNRIYRYLFQLSIVGIAAQIGVGPLSIYYFHQFPLLFWLSNLIVLPLMTPLLILGLITTIASIAAPLPDIIFQFWDELLHIILNFVRWVSDFDQMLLTGLNISWFTLVGYYLIFLLLWWGLQHPRLSRRRLLVHYLPFTCCLLLGGQIFLDFVQNQSKPQFTLLHQFGSTVLITHTAEGNIALTRGMQQNTKLLIDWSSHHNLILSEEKKLPPILSFDARPMIVIDSTGIYPLIRDGIVILTNNANIHFETLVNDLNPRVILADESNYKQIVDRWKTRAKKLNQKFLDTYSLGAIETQEPGFKKYF